MKCCGKNYGEEVNRLPLGAIGLFTATDKIRVGLQQIMAGSRNWTVPYISRRDIFFVDRRMRPDHRHSLRDGRLSRGSSSGHRCLTVRIRPVTARSVDLHGMPINLDFEG